MGQGGEAGQLWHVLLTTPSGREPDEHRLQEGLQAGQDQRERTDPCERSSSPGPGAHSERYPLYP